MSIDCQIQVAPRRPVLRYHGGKFRLAPWIISFFPEHRIYVEPFAGAASILMQKPRVLSEVYNDLDSNIVNVFRVLQEPASAEALRRRLQFTPFAREEFDRTYIDPTDPVDRAAKTIVRSFMGHGSDSATRGVRTGFRAKSHARALPSIEWANWPDEVPAFVDRLRGVVIENRDALEIIDRYDTPSTLFYVDPPYCHSTRGRVGGTHGYRHELSDGDHRNLCEALRRAKGMVVVSGYPSALYSEIYGDWISFAKKHFADRGLSRTEMVWLNARCAEAISGRHRSFHLFGKAQCA